MTSDEFKSKVKKMFLKTINDKKYIDSIDWHIEKTYKDAKELESVLGYSEPDVAGYVLGLSLLYPDRP